MSDPLRNPVISLKFEKEKGGSESKFESESESESMSSFFIIFLMSIFLVYFSVFYIFNLSLSSLFFKSKFWFCISNTLLLIITVDYRVFSPNYSNSKQKQLLRDDYYYVVATKSNSNQTQFKNNIIDQQKTSISNKNLSIISSSSEIPQDKFQNFIEHEKGIDPDQMKRGFQQITEMPGTTFRRSRSEKLLADKKTQRTNGGRLLYGDDERKMKAMRRSESESESGPKILKEENDEFTKMSDEELNKRVEEFIQRFNRQIRLQAAAANRNQN